MKITSLLIKEITGLSDVDPQFECDALALSNSTIPNSLSFIDNKNFVRELNKNGNITSVFVSEDLKGLINGKICIICDDPRYYFFILLNEIGKRDYVKTPTVISPTAVIHPRAYVSENNVTIGDNTIIGPNVTILHDVTIGNNCVIQSGTVIGSEGYEYKRTSKGVLAVFHDGKVQIGNNVEVGANACIDKGFSFRQTIVDDDVKIDNLVHVAHGVQIGKRSFIIAACMLGGSVTIMEDVWIGPNATVAPGLTVDKKGFVTLGSVATRNVAEGEWVTGNFAIPHKKFLSNLKASLSDIQPESDKK
jgi:UDP-3-O-[3-hydroxymyristoyl] glucosamine N-acyltransferase LpxD